MSEIFNDELKRLRSHFMEMGIDASEQIYQATQAFTNHDPELAKQVLSGDSHINTDEVNLEKQALKLMVITLRTLPNVLSAWPIIIRTKQFKIIFNK